jgi:transketolase
MVSRALEAAQVLAQQGVNARVVEMHTIKQLDTDLITQCALETGALVTAEEHSVIGGLGGAVAECVSQNTPVPVERVGVNDTFTESGPYADLLDKYGMSVDAIVAAVQHAVARKHASHTEATCEAVS